MQGISWLAEQPSASQEDFPPLSYLWIWKFVSPWGEEEHSAEDDFGPTRDEVIGGWIKLCNEELHKIFLFADIVRWLSEGGWGVWSCSMCGGVEKCVCNIRWKTSREETTWET
jgi:hypothetical protein